MNKYRVTTKEVYDVTYLVEADSVEEAENLGRNGEGIEVNNEFNDMLENYDVDFEIDVELDDEDQE